MPRGRGKSRGRGREAAGGSRTVGRRDAGTAQGPRSRRGAGAQGAGGPGRGSGRGASTFFAFSSSGSFRPIDTCARPAPAANIFLMSSRGLERARSALQGGFSPGRCFGRRRRARPPGGGHKSLSLSLQGARAEDFLLKFKRKTSFHSAPKNVFPGGQWAPFCASEGRRGGRSGDLCALASPADSRLFPPQSREHGLGFQRPTEARVRTCAHPRERKCPARRASGPGEPRTLSPGPRGCGALPRGASIVAPRGGRTGLWVWASALVLSALRPAPGNK